MTLRQRWKQTSLPNKLLIIVGSFAALSTGLSVAIAYWQYTLAARSDQSITNQIDRLTTLADSLASQLIRANDNQLIALNNSVAQGKAAIEAANTAAADQLATQREAMRLERRAWVAVAQPGRPIIEVGKPVRASIEFMNTGQTPALRVRVNHRLSVPIGLGQTFVPTFPDSGGNHSQSALFPGVRPASTVVSSWTVSDAELSGLRNGLLRLHLFGRIEYDDIFNRPHRTNYCMILLPNLTEYQVCDDYNYAD